MNIKFIESGEDTLAFFLDSQRFFKINDNTKNLITSIREGVQDTIILKKYDLTAEKLRAFKNQFAEYGKSECSNGHGKRIEGLGRLVLNISNKCNLKCKYCYANGGSYCSDEDLMTEETAIFALKRFYEHYKNIYVVQIFGGEPTMNMPVMKAICNYITKHNKNALVKTKIGLVTNGTIMDDNFFAMVKKHDIQVTVSYDGDPLVNDIMRVYDGGEGTSDIILNNIKELKKQTGQPTTIEVTYNQHHVDNRISVLDIIQFVRETVGDIPLHIVPAGGEDTSSYVLKNRDEFIKSVDDVFNNPLDVSNCTYSLVQRIVSSLMTKRNGEHICEAGFDTLSVSVKGDVYPCFMFTDVEDMVMGSIYDAELFTSVLFKSEVSRFHGFKKETISECNECFIKASCCGCLGINYLETGNAFNISHETCEMFRKMTERVILNLHLMYERKGGEVIAS